LPFKANFAQGAMLAASADQGFGQIFAVRSQFVKRALLSRAWSGRFRPDFYRSKPIRRDAFSNGAA